MMKLPSFVPSGMPAPGRGATTTVTAPSAQPITAVAQAPAAMVPTKSEAPAVSSPASIAPTPEPTEIWEEIGEFSEQAAHLRDVIPRVFIATESTKGFAENRWTKGLWTHRGTAEQKRSLELVMAFVVESRAMRQDYDPNASEQKPPVCVSLDAVKGLGSDEHDGTISANAPTSLANKFTHVGPFEIYPGTDCALCRWGQWHGKGPQRKKPACGEEFTIVGMEKEWGPVVVTFRSTAIAPLRKFKSKATHKWLGAKERAASKNPALRKLPSQFFGVAVVTTEEVKKPGSVPYFVPVFDWAEVPSDLFASSTDAAFIQMLMSMRDQLRTLEGMMDAGEVADGDGEGSSPIDFNPSDIEAGDSQWTTTAL